MAVTATRLDANALADIQGILTSGYGHLPHTAYVFVRITNADAGRRWLDDLSTAITSSSPWPKGFDGRVIKPRVAVNVGVTAEGLRALGLPDDNALSTFPAEFREGIASPERSRILGDVEESAPELWEIGGPASPAVHAVLFLFATDVEALDELCRIHRQLLDTSSRGGAAELADSLQRGYRPDTGTEPFGFRDGIAQPSIAGLDGTGVPTGEFILGYENHYGLIPPTPVVPGALDPAETLPAYPSPYHVHEHLRDLGRNGSYMVYRKLQQHVAAFWRFMASEAARYGDANPLRAIWLASKCVGRWPSGAPLTLARHQDDESTGARDDFFYADDRDGLGCPLGAHVRRMNPRDVLEPYPVTSSLSMTEAHRLLRRGRVYGPPLFDAHLLRATANADARQSLLRIEDDGQPRGIHFLCVNASIRSQFEFVQQSWGNNPHFGGLNDNTDPLLNIHASNPSPPSRMTIPDDKGSFRTKPLPTFVTVKAGLYLFVPSMNALRFLAGS